MGRADAQLNALRRHKTAFDFTDDGLGDKLLRIATLGVLDNITNQCAPDGTAWTPLSADYAAWKAFHYPDAPPGILHYVMAQPGEVAGTVYMSTDEARMSYGVDAQARDEMEWFQLGDPAANRPARPFWGFNAQSIEASTRLLTERFKSIL